MSILLTHRGPVMTCGIKDLHHHWFSSWLMACPTSCCVMTWYENAFHMYCPFAMVTSHYLNQYWPRSMTHHGVMWPQWINSLWPSDYNWCHISWSTLAQMAPSHYLNQSWLIISEVQWQSHEGNHMRAISHEIPQQSVTKIRFKISYLKFHLNFPGANELTPLGNGAIWPSLSPCTVINPILLTYLYPWEMWQWFKSMILKVRGSSPRIGCEVAPRWTSQSLANEKSKLVQVMAWCRQATSHYVSQCLPGYVTIWPHQATMS